MHADHDQSYLCMMDFIISKNSKPKYKRRVFRAYPCNPCAIVILHSVYPKLAMGAELLLHQQVAIAVSGALAFGFYFTTFLSCIRWLFFMDEGWNIRQRIRWYMVTITFLIFACNVIYLALVVNSAMVASWRQITHTLSHATPWTNILGVSY